MSICLLLGFSTLTLLPRNTSVNNSLGCSSYLTSEMTVGDQFLNSVQRDDNQAWGLALTSQAEVNPGQIYSALK